MSKILLTIGIHKLILPEKVNCDTLLKILNQGKFVQRDYEDKKESYRPEDERIGAEIEIKIIKDEQFIDLPKRKLLPAQAAPDSDKTF